MSGIVGIVNLDGAPVDRSMLWRMTQYLSPRGPDAQEIWVDENVGFGHALLRTTRESETERQPITLDGHVRITADCRIDAREDLIRKLTAHDCAVQRNAPDPELLLHAWAVWGECCVDHLLGDFAFAIWDRRRRTLFCARDHLGVKPFLYAHVGETLVFSNTLNVVRLHPAVSSRIDELAIADLLVFGTPQDLDVTSFSDIRRLPAAHVLTAGARAPGVKRYWELPVEEEIRYRRRGEYIERFSELLDLAVCDRLRTNSVSVLMSGGLDSPTVAASAHRILSSLGSPFDLRAHTVVYDRIVPDEERKYSQIAADGIGIPIHHYPLDNYRFPPKIRAPLWYPPEPALIFEGNTIQIYHPIVATSRVLLTGYGADPLIDWPSDGLEAHLKQRQYGRLLRDFVWLTWTREQMPRPGFRALLRKRFLTTVVVDPVSPYPEWLEEGLVRQLDQNERGKNENDTRNQGSLKMSCGLLDPFWPYYLESSCDPGRMGLAGEMRHPFLDLRLVRYLLRVPLSPWSLEKSLLRVAMKGVLPDQILRRPKVPLAGNPFALLLPPAQTSWWEEYLVPGHGLENFLNIGRARAQLAKVATATQAVNEHADIDILRQSLQPVGLSLWLKELCQYPNW